LVLFIEHKYPQEDFFLNQQYSLKFTIMHYYYIITFYGLFYKDLKKWYVRLSGMR